MRLRLLHSRAPWHTFARVQACATVSIVLIIVLWGQTTRPFFCDDNGSASPYIPSLFDSSSKQQKDLQQPLHRCFSLPDYSEFCIYHDVCLADHELGVDPAYLATTLHPHATAQIPADDYQNLPIIGTGSKRDLENRLLPWRSFLTLDVKPRGTWAQPSQSVDLAFMSGFDSHSNNVFHFAESVLLYHAVQQWNGTILDFPALSMVLLDRPRPEPRSWISDFASLLFSNDNQNPPILWSDEMGAYTAAAPLCFRRLIVGGTIIHLLQGPREAEALKMKAYAAVGVPHSPRPSSLPRHIVVETRQHRTWKNMEEVVNVLDRVGVPYTMISFANTSFVDQVRAMAGAGVFCSAHGAGMTNVMWMPTGAAVVEVFPSESWEYNLYTEVARNAGLFHVATHGDLLGAERAFGESGKTARNCLNDPQCNVGLKQDFHLDPERFEHALRRALSLAGITS